MILPFRDELERKALETCEDLTLRHEQGVLSDREYKIAMDAVWNTISGLAPALEPIMAQFVGMKLDTRVRLLATAQPGLVIERDRDRVTLVPSRGNQTIKTFDTEAAAVGFVKAAVKRLNERGFATC